MVGKAALLLLGTGLVLSVGVWSTHTYTQAQERDAAIAACVAKNTDGIAASCWRPILMDAYQAGGLARMFAMFSQLYAQHPAFAGNCHDVMHIIGDTAYDAYEATGETVAKSETTYCGYGFITDF